jgi:exonuclease-1
VFWIVIRHCFEQVIFKMDREGNGERIELEKVFSAVSCKPSFRNFDMKLFTGDFLVC